MSRNRRTHSVHVRGCMFREPGVTVCTCWVELERPPVSPFAPEHVTPFERALIEAAKTQLPIWRPRG